MNVMEDETRFSFLGRNVEIGESLQVMIEAGDWFAAEQRGPGEFSLVGCVVAPGFEYQDMEIAGRSCSQGIRITKRLN